VSIILQLCVAVNISQSKSAVQGWKVSIYMRCFCHSRYCGRVCCPMTDLSFLQVQLMLILMHSKTVAACSCCVFRWWD